MLSPRPPELLARNEPETSLHPDLLSPLAHLLADAAQQSQVWVTTHSSQLASELEKLSGAKPVFLEKLEAETQVKRKHADSEPTDGREVDPNQREIESDTSLGTGPSSSPGTNRE